MDCVSTRKEGLVETTSSLLHPADKNSGLSPKLQQQYAGQYPVIQRVGQAAYELDLPSFQSRDFAAEIITTRLGSATPK